MSAALTAQPGLDRTAMAVSMKVKVKGRNRERKRVRKEYHGRRSVCNRVVLSFLPEKSAGRAALSSERCEDMGGAVGAEGTGPAVGIGNMGSRGASGAGVGGCSGWGFLGRQGQVAEVRTFSTGASSLS